MNIIDCHFTGKEICKSFFLHNTCKRIYGKDRKRRKVRGARNGKEDEEKVGAFIVIFINHVRLHYCCIYLHSAVSPYRPLLTCVEVLVLRREMHKVPRYTHKGKWYTNRIIIFISYHNIYWIHRMNTFYRILKWWLPLAMVIQSVYAEKKFQVKKSTFLARSMCSLFCKCTITTWRCVTNWNAPPLYFTSDGDDLEMNFFSICKWQVP